MGIYIEDLIKIKLGGALKHKNINVDKLNIQK
jgi:hypothetical protein